MDGESGVLGMRGTAAPAYGTGRSVMSSGYIRIWEPDHPLAQSDGYVMEHRKVLHDAGRTIPDGHHVHHINQVKYDNRIENLEIVPASEHWRRHGYECVVNQYGEWAIDDPDRPARKALRRREQKAARIERARRDPSIVPHGTSGGATNYGCSCQPCRDALNAVRRARRGAKP